MKSPREKLIEHFKNHCGYTNYEKMFLKNMSDHELNLKLKSYVSALIVHINRDDLKVVETNGLLNIFHSSTLIRTYSTENIIALKNENQLGLSLFVEWGCLIHSIGKTKKEQLMLAL